MMYSYLNGNTLNDEEIRDFRETEVSWTTINTVGLYFYVL